MADITASSITDPAPTVRGTRRPETYVVTSGPASIGDTITLTGLPAQHRHCTASVILRDGSGDITVGSAGTITVEVQSLASGQWAALGSTIDATDPADLDFTQHVTGIKASAAALAGITTWELVLVCSPA
jgi:hypothetical protein